MARILNVATIDSNRVMNRLITDAVSKINGIANISTDAMESLDAIDDIKAVVCYECEHSSYCLYHECAKCRLGQAHTAATDKIFKKDDAMLAEAQG